ncbi:urease subunit gamma [Nonomuraea sp. NPDC048881]|uniref:urease subunit gamma n=1 Tax=Nonomuraea sp. NPDC048881 TaxID=3155030 RepID=UPI0033D9B71D
MHLTLHEQERLMIHVAADVAHKRRGRVKLNYPEAVAILTSWVLEEARAGRTVADLMAKQQPPVLMPHEVMPGVAEMIADLQIEATFPDGTKMVTLREPIPLATTLPCPSDPAPSPCGALPQPCPPDPEPPPCPPDPGPPPCPPDPGPSARVAGPGRQGPPGAIDFSSEGGVSFNDGRPITTVRVTNTDDRHIQVGSHYHFYEVNSRLDIHPDRDAAYGKRLNIPAGGSVRFAPNMPQDVELVPIEGRRHVAGLNGKVGGNL